jgi:hypothetical protein
LKKGSEAVGMQSYLRKYLARSVFSYYQKEGAVKDLSGHKVGALIHPIYVEL